MSFEPLILPPCLTTDLTFGKILGRKNCVEFDDQDGYPPSPSTVCSWQPAWLVCDPQSDPLMPEHSSHDS